ncbi:MAG TPA: sulfur carrier protein ThiS [Solirubrobacteraceae bacterium]
MIVSVNGRERELPPGATVAAAIEILTDAPEGRGVAVALAGEVVPRGAWESTELTEGAAVEIVAAVQGG